MWGVAFWCGIRKRTVISGESCPCPLSKNLCEEYGGPWSEKVEELTKGNVKAERMIAKGVLKKLKEV